MTTFDSQNIFVDFIILHFTVFFTFQLRNIIISVKKIILSNRYNFCIVENSDFRGRKTPRCERVIMVSRGTPDPY